MVPSFAWTHRANNSSIHLAATSPDRDVAAADLLLRGPCAVPITREPTAAFGPLNGNTQGLYSGAIIRQGQLHDVVSFDARFRAVGINLDRVRLAGELGLARGPQSDTEDRDSGALEHVRVQPGVQRAIEFVEAAIEDLHSPLRITPALIVLHAKRETSGDRVPQGIERGALEVPG